MNDKAARSKARDRLRQIPPPRTCWPRPHPAMERPAKRSWAARSSRNCKAGDRLWHRPARSLRWDRSSVFPRSRSRRAPAPSMPHTPARFPRSPPRPPRAPAPAAPLRRSPPTPETRCIPPPARPKTPPDIRCGSAGRASPPRPPSPVRAHIARMRVRGRATVRNSIPARRHTALGTPSVVRQCGRKHRDVAAVSSPCLCAGIAHEPNACASLAPSGDWTGSLVSNENRARLGTSGRNRFR